MEGRKELKHENKRKIERREIKRETRWRQVEKRRMWEGRGEGERKIESRPRENPHTYMCYVGANTKLCAGICQEPVPGAHSLSQTDRTDRQAPIQRLLARWAAHTDHWCNPLPLAYRCAQSCVSLLWADQD